MYLHDAILKAYPNVKTIRNPEPPETFVECVDWDGNQVIFDEALVAAAEIEVELEFAWKRLRSERTRLLAETDYLALPDVTMSDEMRAYRQTLRDLPANTTDPANPVWPVKPGGDS